MIYSFDGTPAYENRPDGNDHMAFYDSGFTEEELEWIRNYGDALDTTNVKLFGKSDPERVRATGAHFKLNDETRWVYERMATRAMEINGATYQFDLNGFEENFYYLSYVEEDHFDWHLDIGHQTTAPRKLSLILQLSSPKEYEGGDFDILVTKHHMRAVRRKGMMLAFPAYKIHRVTPVTKGKRRTLAAFVSGPMFR